MKAMVSLVWLALPLWAAAGPSPQDSIGVKKVNGKLFIRHKVEKGEGLLALCRRYHVSKADVLASNEGMSENLNLGQEVLFPVMTPAPQPQQGNPRNNLSETHAEADAERPKEHLATDAKPASDYHLVKAGETLYRIAQQYRISEADLRTWNGLNDGSLKEGQKLWLRNMQAPPVPSRPDSTAGRKDSLRSKSTATVTAAGPHPLAGSGNVKEVEESGVARWFMDDELSGGHQLALHKTAPVGTIIKLTNRMTNKTVFVRVVGVLPNTDENKNILIKISRSTAEKIGMRDEQTQVKLNYALD